MFIFCSQGLNGHHVRFRTSGKFHVSGFQVFSFPDFEHLILLKFKKSLIACKSDTAQLPKSWFLVNNLTKNCEVVNLTWGVFNILFFWLFVFKIVNPSRPRRWKWQWRPLWTCKSPQRLTQTSNHWKSTLTSCRSVDWPKFWIIKMVKNFSDVIDRKSTFR